MLIRWALKVSVPLSMLSSAVIEQVDTFKLLRDHISTDLKWACHVIAILSKVASHLYCLKQLYLKLSGAGVSAFITQLDNLFSSTPDLFGTQA